MKSLFTSALYVSATNRRGVPIRPARFWFTRQSIRSIILVLTVLGSWLSMPAESQGVGKPTQIVDALHDALIEVASRGDVLSYESRFQQLEPAINDSHDFLSIARLVGGHFWKSLNDNERSRLADALRCASIATYASRFASASGVSFDQAQVDHRIDDRVTVRSHLIRDDGSRVVFVYVLQDKRDQWRIISILVDGVSELALRRAELTKIFDDAGFRGVIEHLNTQVHDPATSWSAATAEHKTCPPKSSMVCRTSV